MENPVVDVVRIGDQVVFECPYCWTYGGSYGACDVDAGGYYKRRPKRAKPKKHFHGTVGPEFGDGDGWRSPHCFLDASPFWTTGYILREVES